MTTPPSGILIRATGRLDQRPRLLRDPRGRTVCAFELTADAEPSCRPITKRVLVLGTTSGETGTNPAYRTFLFLKAHTKVTVFGVERDRDWHLWGCHLRGARLEACEVQMHEPRTHVLFASAATEDALFSL